MKSLSRIEDCLVLIVDDIPENLQVLANILSERNLNVAFATSGLQAIDITNGEIKPDLILLDVSMPGMDGFAVCEKLKLNPETKNIPIIFLTAHVQSEDIIKGFRVGGIDYVTKPFNHEELLSRVFTHLELKISRDMIVEQNNSLVSLNNVLEQKNRELEELIDKKNEFLGFAAHDLRNPLTFIMAFSELLYQDIQKNTLDLNKSRVGIKRIIDVSKRMAQLINDILSISAIEFGKVKMNKQDENVIEILKGTLEFFTRVASEKSIRLLFEVNNNLEIPKMKVDKVRITQIFENLLSNAIKYTFPGGEVKVSYEIDKNKMIIHIQDTGQGLDENDRLNLFKSFKKLSATPTGGETSTGLGLAIVKKLVDLHNGEILVESEKGKGSTFNVILPV